MKVFKVLVFGLLVTGFHQGQAYAACQPATKAQIKKEIRKTIQFKLSKEELNAVVNSLFDGQCKGDINMLAGDFQGLDPATIQKIANDLNSVNRSNGQNKVSDSKTKTGASENSEVPVPANGAATATPPK